MGPDTEGLYRTLGLEGEELFVVGRRVSSLADDKAVSSCLDDFDRDNPDVVDAQGCSFDRKVAQIFSDS